uniref:Uncharacterized protein n=1 Tax=Cucumis melo TaxID=3656 RepID=A0A9I9EEX7_CUCME
MANPTLIPINLSVIIHVAFLIFCKCPNPTQLQIGYKHIRNHSRENWPNPQSFNTIFIKENHPTTPRPSLCSLN